MSRESSNSPGRRFLDDEEDAYESKVVERAVRAAADEELVARVREAGMDSVEARYLQHALADFGAGTLVSMWSTGRIFFELRARNIGVPLPVPRSFNHDAHSVIHLAVASALPQFMEECVVENGWDRLKGSSLATYFVGRCLLTFSREYRTYFRQEADLGLSIDFSEFGDEGEIASMPHSNRGGDPELAAVDRDMITRLGVGMSPQLRHAFARMAAGLTQAEIAAELGLAESALNSMIRRYRMRTADVRDGPGR